MKKILFIASLLIGFRVFAEPDTTYLKAMYDRCLDFDESKKDSLQFYIKVIEDNSGRLSFKKGDVLSLRLKGLLAELSSDYSGALEYYLKSLEAARKLEEKVYETAALSDLAIIYSLIEQPALAKKYYLLCAALALQTKEVYSLSTSYNNLGIIYNQLGDHDSALLFLNEALKIDTNQAYHLDPSSALNNIGNAYFKKGQYEKALSYFLQNYKKHSTIPDVANPLWIDHLNLSDAYIELKKYDRARIHADSALLLASQLGSKAKLSDSYSILSKLYARQKNYDKAYDFLTKWYQLDTALINGSTQNKIAELQERFNLIEREAENKLLLAQIEKERYRSRSAILLSIGLGITGLLILLAFLIKRNANRKLEAKNKTILRQNERLEELNYEKNALIGIVSHDLSTPFATIQMWSQVLESNTAENTVEQQKAINRILQASSHGQQLIQRILAVEKADLGSHKTHITNMDVKAVLQSVLESIVPIADKKYLEIISDYPNNSVMILSDEQLVYRIFENLLSNAIKYSISGRKIWVTLTDKYEAVVIKFKDEGVGIPADEIPHLFTKYNKISSKPTAGETSTGLGLSIVKRIVEELNGQISCESQEGVGTTFTVLLPK